MIHPNILLMETLVQSGCKGSCDRSSNTTYQSSSSHSSWSCHGWLFVLHVSASAWSLVSTFALTALLITVSRSATRKYFSLGSSLCIICCYYLGELKTMKWKADGVYRPTILQDEAKSKHPILQWLSQHFPAHLTLLLWWPSSPQVPTKLVLFL